ncbi:MFS transporter [Candidatus Kaiserbacteria bacterium]|nr:MFS transporter [Candidatus Kaiserbacteria bacterium]
MLKILQPSSVSTGVQGVTIATAIRWFGWAFVDPLIPVFLFMFSESFLQTGLLASIYSVVFLISVPIVSFISDHIRAKYVILAGLAIYPLIALSYYFAGVYGMAAFIAIARALNGISYALDATGRATYVRRHTDKQQVGTAFGFFQIFTEGWRTLAMLLSIVVIKYVEIHELFLFIIPTTLIAMFIVSRIEDSPCDYQHKADWASCIHGSTYMRFIQEVMIWKNALKKLALVSFVFNALTAAIALFVPIFLYADGVSLERIIIFSIIANIPFLFGYHAGKIADTYGTRLLSPLSFVLALLMGALAFVHTYEWYLVVVFIFNMCISLGLIIIDAEMTRCGDDRKYGALSGAILEVAELASVISPIAVGFSITMIGQGNTLLGLGVVMVIVALLGVRGLTCKQPTIVS